MGRREIRVPTYCRVTYSGYEGEHTGTGILTNISMEGCQIVGIQSVAPGSPVWVRLSLPGEDKAIEIDVAKVQWVRGLRFGLHTLELGGDYRDRLQRFLHDNYVGCPGIMEQPEGTDLPSVNELSEDGSPAQAITQRLDTPSGLHPDLQISLGDLLAFVQWMLEAQMAMSAGDILPAPLHLRSESLKSCVRFVQELQDKMEKAETRLNSLTQILQTHDSDIDKQLIQVHSNLAVLYESLGMSQKADEIRRVRAIRESRVSDEASVEFRRLT